MRTRTRTSSEAGDGRWNENEDSTLLYYLLQPLDTIPVQFK